MRRCAICGSGIKGLENNTFAFCPDCRDDLKLIGRTDRHKMKANLVPPPTTEVRVKQQPPPPPPMRTQHQVPTWLEPGYRVLTIAVVLALGFFLGWIARGGV